MAAVSGGQTRQGRVALVLVDLRNSYFEFPELAEEEDRLREKANELIAAARENGHPVVLVRTEHTSDKATWTISMLEDDQGFAFPGTDQAAYIDGLDVDGCIDLTKTRDSAFHDTPLLELLTDSGVERVLLGGVSTHSCVAQTATDAFANDLYVSIAGEAIASDNATLSEAMLDFLGDTMRQPLLDQADSLALLREGPPGPT